jgi:uncharacterized protein YjbI with pentapeptide repeats
MASRRPAKTRPDPPDLPERLDAGPAALAAHERIEGARIEGGLEIGDRVEHAELRECVLVGVDLSGRVLTGFGARDVRFERCDLSGAVLDSAALQRVEFAGCRMTGTVLSAAALRDVRISDSRADLANFRMARAEYLLIERTALREAEFYAAALTHSALLGCDLVGANFAEGRFAAVDLHGCELDGLRGAGSLGGASIAADQLYPLAAAVLAATGVTITDEPRLS